MFFEENQDPIQEIFTIAMYTISLIAPIVSVFFTFALGYKFKKQYYKEKFGTLYQG